MLETLVEVKDTLSELMVHSEETMEELVGSGALSLLAEELRADVDGTDRDAQAELALLVAGLSGRFKAERSCVR